MKKDNTPPRAEQAEHPVSPYAVNGGDPAETRPLFTSTGSTGLRWSGTLSGADIVKLKGKTYGDTNINLDNPDTQQRIARAREAIPKDTGDIYKSQENLSAFFDKFSARIHKPDVVGDYFPEVLRLKAQQDDLMDAASERVLAGAAAQEISELNQSRSAQNSADWTRRTPRGIVEDQAVKDIEERNEEIDRAVLNIQRQRASEILGAEAAKIEANALKGMEGLKDYEREVRVVSQLMHAAAEKRLPEVEAEKSKEAEAKGQEFKTHAQLKEQEKALWDKKHASQDDFSQAIKDGNPDCSEYASLSAVSLAQSGIPNLRVMGHVMHDSKYAHVGAHAYNVIMDQSGKNIVGVFEGTATSGSFRKVVNNVSLAEFQAGKTLVTMNDEGQLSTYGTGSPAQGKDLYTYDRERGGIVCDLIERADAKLISNAKVENIRSTNPEAIADKLIGMYKQYGDITKVQGWLNSIRDDGDPAFAQAAQILHDYKGPMPPPTEIKTKITEIVSEAKQRGLSGANYEIAVTGSDLAKLEGTFSTYLGVDLKETMDKLQKLDPAQLKILQEQKPWLAEAMDLMRGRGSHTDALLKDSNKPDLDAYRQLAGIVRHNDINIEDLKDLNDAVRQQNAVKPIAAPAL